MGNQRRMAAFTDEPVVPMITDLYRDEVLRIHENIFNKALGVATLVQHTLMNRSSLPDAMPVDNPVPISDGKLHRQIGRAPGPQEHGYGPIR